MLNYEVDPSLLSRLVPPGTELDFWNHKTYISLVGFQFLKTRVLGMSFPFDPNFEEVNLRFYVQRGHGTESRRGVVFDREIVPRKAVAAIAGVFYGEQYVALPCAATCAHMGRNWLSMRGWKLNDHWNHVNVTVFGAPTTRKAVHWGN